MRNINTLITGIAVFTLAWNNPTPAQGQVTNAANSRFQAELNFNDKDNNLHLSATFYGNKPATDKIEQSLRHLLEATSVIYPDLDITARAWHSTSAKTSDRSAIILSNGAETLVYQAQNKSISSTTQGDAHSDVTKTESNDEVATVLADSSIVKSCKDYSQEQITHLANAAIEKQGEERKYILKAMRDWCEANDVELSRKMRVCMSSISKAIVALHNTPNSSPEDAEAVARGKQIFEGDHHCSNCHESGGKGGLSGPNLSDDEWLHCDGSIEGIKKVILSGVSRSQLKDDTRPWPMHPVKDLKNDEKQLNDLATYVYSLRQK